MPEDLLTNLTEAQREAVTHTDGPCLVVAGPGTGKTTVVTRRIANLILHENAKPEQIVALTFTDKAAKEMEERVDQLLPYGITGTTISTFHSFCSDIVKRHAFLIGIDPSSQLLGTADEIGFLREHLDELPTKLYRPSKNPVEFLRMLVQFMGKAKDEYLLPDAILSHAHTAHASAVHEGDEAKSEEALKLKELAEIYKTAQQLYADASVLSYADLIFHAVTILREHPSALAAEQRQIKYLLVDEFQDTNSIQSEVARLLAGDDRNIMVVGDDDQAIYSFRGANLANILGFTKSFPETRVITLKDNYRSNQYILNAAYRLIQRNNPERLEVVENIGKRLTGHHQAGSQPEHWHFERGASEYAAIAEKISEFIGQEIYKPEDIAVLVRSKSHARGIEAAFQQRGIPYQYAGSGKFYTLPTIQAALALLRFLTDPHDDANLFYCLTQVPFEVTHTTLQPFTREAKYLNVSLWDHLAGVPGIEPALQESLTYLKGQLEIDPSLPASRRLVELLHSSGWHERLLQLEDQRPLDLLATMYHEIVAFEGTRRDPSLAQYVAYIDHLLATEEDVELKQGSEQFIEGVQIMTAHKSKGLEFPVVFVSNLVQGRFPARNYSDGFPFPHELTTNPSGKATTNLPEERRLAYVAMTRAKERLYLTSSELYDDRKTRCKLSPFVIESLEMHDQPVARSEASTSTLSIEKAHAPNEPVASLKRISAGNTFSVSALETYEQCPRKYRYQYVLQLKVPSSYLSNFGTSVHETLRKWFEARQQGREAEIETLFASSWIPGGYESKRHEERQYAEGLEKIRAYVAQEETIPIALEQTVKAKLPNGSVLIGKVDRIDALAGGGVRVVDYKTSERPISIKDAANHLPLGGYAMALEQLGQDVQELELQYIMVGERVTLPISQINTEGIRDRALQTVVAIQESSAVDQFPAKPDRILCSYCDYRDICPFRYGRT